jgi:hypothetical protein
MLKIMLPIYHVFTKNGGIEPPFLAAIPPRPIAAHPCLTATEIASIESGDSRDSVELLAFAS